MSKRPRQMSYVPGRGWVYARPKGSPMPDAVRESLRARAEAEARWAAWLRLWARVGVETLRPSARERVENYVINPDSGREMFAAALTDYKHRYPQARGDNHTVTRIDPALPARASLACRYCGRVVWSGLRGNAYGATYYSATVDHTARCALESLAGVRVPVPPGYNPVDPARVALAFEQLSALVRVVVLAWAADVVTPSMLRYSNLEPY